MKFLYLITFTLVLFLTVAAAGDAASLTVSYFERPPYYFTDTTGTPAGFLYERTRNILEEAGVDADFISSTPYRILYVIQHATVPHCSTGWFKNPERELFAKFSEPIYRDQALVLLTSKAQRKQIGAKKSLTLREVFSRRQLAMARMSEFSYGDAVDKLLGELVPKSIFLSGQQSSLLQAVVDQRAAYMLVAPEEIDMLITSTGMRPKDFVSIQLTDLPAGNLRYLMCNQAVADETLLLLNEAIRKLYPVP